MPNTAGDPLLRPDGLVALGSFSMKGPGKPVSGSEPVAMGTADIVARLHVHRNSPIPKFLQLKSQFEYLIVTGECPPGQRLPSIRTVSSALHVGPATITRAYRELEAAHLAVSAGGLGFFVIGRQASQSESHGRVRTLISEVLENAIAEGLSLDQVFEIFVAQVAESRVTLGRPNLVLICKKEGRTTELAMHIRHALADLGAEVATVALEELREDPEGWLPTLRKAHRIVCLLWDVKQTQELLAGKGIEVVPLLAVLRDDVRETVAGLPGNTRVGIIASSNQFIDGMITAVSALNPAITIVGSADAEHRQALRTLSDQADCIIYGTPARAMVKQELDSTVDAIEFIYVPDPSSLQHLRRLIQADLHMVRGIDRP
jgi:DNA-binding transcriptional regulator YhcF (GntR family)